MHVGILAAIAADRLPIATELLGGSPVCLVPEAGRENLAYVAEQPIGARMADDLGARSREQNEGMAIGLLAVVARTAVADAPEIAAMDRVAMAPPEEVHAVVYERVGAGPPQEAGDGETMDHAR